MALGSQRESLSVNPLLVQVCVFRLNCSTLRLIHLPTVGAGEAEETLLHSPSR